MTDYELDRVDYLNEESVCKVIAKQLIILNCHLDKYYILGKVLAIAYILNAIAEKITL